MKKLLVLLALLFGCDSSAVLANIDTYTCAYLPSVVDCTTEEVHDKAVSILENGVVEANIDCYLEVPYQKPDTYLGPEPLYTTLTAKYSITAFHDGTVYASCQAGGPINRYAPWTPDNLQHYSGSRFSARSSGWVDRRLCDIQIFTLEISPFVFELTDGVIHVQKAGLYDSYPHEYYEASEFCSGFNLEYFE